MKCLFQGGNAKVVAMQVKDSHGEMHLVSGKMLTVIFHGVELPAKSIVILADAKEQEPKRRGRPRKTAEAE